jgi:hypothetical protein
MRELSVTINNGLHWHGIVLMHPGMPELREPLDHQVKQNLGRSWSGISVADRAMFLPTASYELETRSSVELD